MTFRLVKSWSRTSCASQLRKTFRHSTVVYKPLIPPLEAVSLKSALLGSNYGSPMGRPNQQSRATRKHRYVFLCRSISITRCQDDLLPPPTPGVFNGMGPSSFIPGIVPEDGHELWWGDPLGSEGFDPLSVYPPPSIRGSRMHQLISHYHHESPTKAPHNLIPI